MPLTNRQISELLARRAEQIDDRDRARAYRRAARAALGWPLEVAELLEQERPLTELDAIGDRLAGAIRGWFDKEPEVPEPPEERRDFLTLAEARAELADAPEWRAELRGDLQMHTLTSDGRATVGDMAESAVALGHEYIAITEHSVGLRIAGGVDEEGFRRQRAEIDAVNRALAAAGSPVTVVQGIEMNLDVDGHGDMDAAFLRELDLVLGSFHSALRRSEDQTERYVRALRNPDVHVLGHPRARMFNRRRGLVADWDRVVEAAASSGKALEIDCHPNRQDLNVELLRLAARAGCTVSIGTDAHNQQEMSFVELGVAAARRARIPRERIVNFWPLARVRAWVAELRGD